MDQAGTSDTQLQTPDLLVSPTENFVVTLSHRYSFEADTIFWDGGVIELSVNGGAWEDVSTRVNPGYGGQSFIPSALAKISATRALIEQRNPTCRLQVDGGIKASNLRRVVEAGADTVVVGSAIFTETQPVADAVHALRAALA